MNRSLLISAFLILTSFFSQSTLFLMNDTPFEMTVRVESQSGVILGSYPVKPYEQKNVEIDTSKFSANTIGESGYLLTPYNVIWQCKAGGQYGLETDVSPGSSVRATLSVGASLLRSP